MDGTDLQHQARTRALELPATEVGQFFGPGWDVFKVKGKVFMLLTEEPGSPVVILKATPTDSEALREQYSEVSRGYHMNKRHWITVSAGSGIDEPLVDELVTESYLLVVERNLPKREWPVDPETFRG